MTWQPDYREVYKRRVRMIEAARDPQQLALITQYYKTHPVEWISDWATTFDPRKAKFMPFVLFERQREFINFLQSCLADRESGLVEKSRDVGATWLCVAFGVWLILYHSGVTVGFGSLNVQKVDKIGDPDSILEKARILIRRLPAFMVPRAGIRMAWKKILNAQNGSNITGDGGDNIGRGGRSSIFFKDESAHYEHPQLIEAALSENSDVQIDISSVNGTGNIFYNRRMAGEVWHPDRPSTAGKTRVFIFDWRDNPIKTQEWYDLKRERYEADGLMSVFAQEVDRDYAASVQGVVIQAKWVNAAIDAHKKLGIEISGAKIAGLDVADEGNDKNAYVARHGILLQGCQTWGGVDTSVTADNAAELSIANGIYENYYDAIGVGAGVKGELNRQGREKSLPRNVKFYPWIASKGPMDPDENVIPLDIQSPTNKDFFKNLKAQGWWRLRLRFEKTYRAVTKGIKYDPADLISIDSQMDELHELKQELSQVVYKKDNSGKIMIDKKPDGAMSPNRADATVICYNPVKEVSSFDIV
jgi:hypothetical protein